MKIFSSVSTWFSALIRRFSSGGSAELVSAFESVERTAIAALPAVAWVGDVVVTAIQNSHLPIADIIEEELKKFAPEVPNIRDQAVRLAAKDRADMLLALAVLVLQYASSKSVPLRILRTAVEVAHLIYSAQKGK